MEADFVQLSLEADFCADQEVDNLEADFEIGLQQIEVAVSQVGLLPHLEAVLVGHLEVYFEQQLEAVFHLVELTCWPRSEAVLELHWKAERLEAG